MVDITIHDLIDMMIVRFTSSEGACLHKLNGSSTIAPTLDINTFTELHEYYISNPDELVPLKKDPLANKKIRNIHTNLFAPRSCAVDDEFVNKNVIQESDQHLNSFNEHLTPIST